MYLVMQVRQETGYQFQEMKSINHAKLPYLSKLFLALWC